MKAMWGGQFCPQPAFSRLRRAQLACALSLCRYAIAWCAQEATALAAEFEHLMWPLMATRRSSGRQTIMMVCYVKLA